MESFEAWKCVAERMDHSSLANVEAAFGSEREPGAAARRERETRYEIFRKEMEGEVDRIRSALIERGTMTGPLDGFFCRFADLLEKRAGQSEDAVDLYVHSFLPPSRVTLFTKDHYLACRMLLPLDLEPRRECELSAPLVKVADAVNRLDSPKLAPSLAWVFFDALGLEEGSLVLFLLTVGTRRDLADPNPGSYCSPPVHAILALATECWNPRSRTREKVSELVEKGRQAVASARTKSFNLEMARRMLRNSPFFFLSRRAGARDYAAIRTGDFSTFEWWRENVRAQLEAHMSAYEGGLRKVRDAMSKEKSAKMANAAVVFDRNLWTVSLSVTRGVCCAR